MFESIGAKIAAALISAILLLSAGAYGGYRWELSAYESLVASNEEAQTKAVTLAKNQQAASDAVTLKSAVAEATAQQKIAASTSAITKEIPRHVTPKQDASSCITYGLVRVLDATVLNADPGALPLPAGKSDDSCAPVEASALAGSVVSNYGSAKANAEQLNALIAWANAQSVTNPAPAVKP